MNYPFIFQIGDVVSVGPNGKRHEKKRGVITALELSQGKTIAVVSIPNPEGFQSLRFVEGDLRRASS